VILAFNLGFLEISWVDILDIVFVSILLYQVYKLMRGTVAVRVFIGFLSLYLIFLMVKAAGMELLTSILGQFMGVGFLAAIILFQQEIRKFLLLIGKTTALNRDNFFKILFNKSGSELGFFITPIIEAVKHLAATNTGALIVFSKGSALKFYAESGDLLDALISKRLVLSVFNKESPLHDGAMIIHDGKIKAARCILPVSENDDLSADYGLRHRAGLGMSEITDTLVIIVSEETGQISIAKNGKILSNLSPQEIRRKINRYYHEKTDAVKEKDASQNTSVELKIDPEEISTKAG
jgi:diadenylate cyclase